jgi:hypothetical protein
MIFDGDKLRALDQKKGLFNEQLKRLDVQWKNFYGLERQALIWQAAQSLSIESFARVVTRILAEFRQPPLLPEIRGLIAEERERIWGSQKVIPISGFNWAKFSNCNDCGGTGALRAVSKTQSTGMYAFKCHCEYGQRDRRNFPQWTSDRLEEFEIYGK